jgi:ribosomal protein S8
MRRVLIVLVAIFCVAATWAQPKSAKLSFERESHDFGRVLRGEGDVSVEFRFTNEGTAPLVVKKATTTCSCTTVEFSKKPIMPGKQGTIRVTLKYLANKQKVIRGIRRISKPGLRIYASCEDMPKVMNGLGIAIVSTSKGIMTDKAARAQHVGGEVIAFVW